MFTALFGCSVYKKVASLAANQEGLPEPSAQSAARSAAVTQPETEQAASSTPSTTQEQPAQAAAESEAQHPGSTAGGIVMQSEGTQSARQEGKPLGTSLFQGAMRRLAGKQSEGAPDVQVRRAVPLGLATVLPAGTSWQESSYKETLHAIPQSPA